MRLRSDTHAASPLVVLTTFVLGAVVLTVLLYALVFDRPEPELQVVQVEDGGVTSFKVSQAGGGLEWSQVKLRLIDRANTDQAGNFLVKPTGGVDEGDVIRLEPAPPSGTYVLLVSKGGAELSRLVVEL